MESILGALSSKSSNFGKSSKPLGKLSMLLDKI